MIIGACGFTGSGSSSVTDYLKEYDSLTVFDKLEFILCHAPDGLEDLDYQLNYHRSKYTSSEVAIHRFFQHVENYLINRISDDKKKRAIREATNEYIDSITQASWIGCGSADVQLHSSSISRYIFNLSRSVITKLPVRIKTNWNLYPAHKMYFSINPDDFYEKSKKYVNMILSILGLDSSKPIVLNQPFSGNCPQNAFPFFDNPLAIVVDRDPRDIYTSTVKSYVPLKGCYNIPSKDVATFVEYYRGMHNNQPYRNEDNRVLVIRFEDMVYEYEATTDKIIQFCNLNESDHSRKVFDPSKSIVNTQAFKRFPDLKKEIEYIERELEEYLYDFDSYGPQQINGKLWT